MKRLTIKSLKTVAVIALAGSIAFGCGSAENAPPQGPISSGSAPASSSESSGAVASEDGVGRFAGKEVPAFDAALADQGEAIFVSKCSACHRTTSEKIVGPGLKDVTERRKAQWILNMITNPVEMTQKDPIGQSLLAEHLTQMTNQDVSDEDALKLLNYLRKNDAAK